jgi:hypothetical protein
MLDLVAHSNWGFWAVAALIAAIDSSLLLRHGQVTFTIGNRLCVEIRISRHPFLLHGLEPIVTLITYPFCPFFLATTQQEPSGRSGTRRILVQQKRVARKCKCLAGLALASLALILIAGPIASLQYGVGRALILIAPPSYLLALSAVILVFLNRSVYRLDGADIAHIALELLLCPVLVINIIKKICVRQQAACVLDLVNHFSRHRDRLAARLSEHLDATAPR